MKPSIPPPAALRPLAVPAALRPAVDAARALLASRPDLRTPFLLLDRRKIEEQVARWARPVGVPMHYAVKANSDPLLLRLLIGLGVSFDVATANEIRLLADLGVSMDRVIVTHPVKDPETVEALAAARPWAFVVDTDREFDKFTRLGFPRPDYQPVVLVRIKTESTGVMQDLSSKFGHNRRHALEVLKAAWALGYRRLGLAFHVGTQCHDPDNYRRALVLCDGIIADARAAGVPVGWLDIGGGFCDARVAAAHGTTQDALLTAVGRLVREREAKGLRVIGEPGRLVVADAGHAVSRVLSVYQSDLSGRRIWIDDSLYLTFLGQLHDGRHFAFHPFRATGQPHLALGSECIVFGGTCDSFDRFESAPAGDASAAGMYRLPVDLDEGDYLISDCAGAYSVATSTGFNGVRRPAVVLYWASGDGFEFRVSPSIDQDEIVRRHLVRATAEVAL